MKTRTRLFAAVVLVGALGWALNGCSNSPLSPENPAGAGGSGFSVLTVSPTGGTGFISAPTGSALAGRLGPNLSGASGGASLASAAVIDGSIGGRLECGRYTLTVPPGAFSGTATITMTLPDSTVMLCDLAIAPLERNAFSVPVRLSLGTQDLLVDRSSLGIYWYDPAHLTWVNLFAGSDPTSETLTAQLTHFSTYAAGKAGW